ncbi:MAG: flagellar motor protein MotB [Defluviitaleaceae bacterium]|nr:flagellar motor protein MotB [Defluviitaleaceae bacterium]MCL2261766.1 flagellar motor protein MotB [Defluviitaleaceae bacterium]
MKKQKKAPEGAKMVLPGWMASYADMFTVMMVFFILLYAMSQIDEELFERFLASFQGRPAVLTPITGASGDILANTGEGILPEVIPPEPDGIAGDPEHQDPGLDARGDTVGEMMNTFMMYLPNHQPIDPIDPVVDPGDPAPHPSIAVVQGENYIRININEIVGEGVLFNSGQARLTPYAVAALNYLGPVLSNFAENGHGIVVEGHTDNQPINTPAFPSNWTLSGARASSVVEHLVNNAGIDVHMIAGLGRGEYFPIGDNNTADGRAENRRVEIKVFTQDATTGGPIGGWFIPGTV